MVCKREMYPYKFFLPPTHCHFSHSDTTYTFVTWFDQTSCYFKQGFCFLRDAHGWARRAAFCPSMVQLGRKRFSRYKEEKKNATIFSERFCSPRQMNQRTGRTDLFPDTKCITSGAAARTGGQTHSGWACPSVASAGRGW